MRTVSGRDLARVGAMCGLIALAFVSTSAALATPPVAVGWWWQGRPTSPIPSLLAPDVPDGGLYVAGQPTGAVGVSALRFDVPAGTRSSSLSLAVVEATGTPRIDACPSMTEWTPAAGGSWDQRAAADCAVGLATGTFSPDGTTLTFDTSSFTSAGQLDVVLLPARDPGTGLVASFTTTFAPPGQGALTTAVTPAAPSTAATPTTTPRPRLPPPSPEPLARHGTVLPRRPEAVAPSVLPTPPAGASHPTGAPPPPPTVVAAGTFAYPSVLLLPLGFLTVGAYLGWSLNHPLTAPPRMAAGAHGTPASPPQPRPTGRVPPRHRPLRRSQPPQIAPAVVARDPW